MADHAIGISKTAVQELAKRVKNAKEEEAKQWQTVERDIVFMKHEFEMMQSFLASAAAAGNFRAGVGRTWVRQVRELSDGAEDCIDYVLHLDTERSLRTLSLRVLPSCMRGAAVLPLDKAVSDIQQLKAMVEDVSKRNMRYSLGGGDCSGSSMLVPVAGHTQLIASSAASASTLGAFVEAKDTAMNKAAADRLIEFVAEGYQGLRIFCVCGTGGDLGKISIVRKAYEDPAFCSQFPLLAWVKLTQPFDPLGFVGSLVVQFEANSHRQQGRRIVVAAAAQKPPPEQLVGRFIDDICNMKYLIVLEDVRSMAEWDATRAFLPDQNKGSRVIVLTHQLEIASLCTGTKPVQVSPLRVFSPHHSVCVFYQDHQQAQASKFKPIAAIVEAQASGEHQAKPTAAEITQAQASGEQQAKSTAAVITEMQASGVQQVKPATTAEIMEAQASGEQQAKPMAAEITEAQASGEQQAKPTTAMITEAQASGEQQVKPATAAEIMEAEASGDRLRSHCSEGFDSQVNKLEVLITYWRWRDQHHRVISACAGKSSVVKTIYYRCLDREAQEDLFDSYAWVVVPDPLDINELCRRLLWIMEGGSRHDDGGNIKSQCQRKLRSRRNLIFIDGLQSEADWDSITTELRLSEYEECCIVVVTKEKRVAQHCAAHQSLVCNISDQGYLAPHPLQHHVSFYQGWHWLPEKFGGLERNFKRGPKGDDDDNDNNYLMRPKGTSRLSKAYDWLHGKCLWARDSCEEKKLEKLITSPDCRRGEHHHVISVFGIAGSGKSFIVRTIYSRCIQREMLEDLFGHYVWVDAPHPFRIMDFCQRLFLEWIGKSKDVDVTDFVGECLYLLRKKRRVLVVIDGLRSTDDWDYIQANLPLAASASCIVVVTSDPTVAKHCATTEHEICSITSLEEHATRRFIRDQICEVVPAGTSGQGDPKMTKRELKMLTDQAFDIMNKCGRSPEVIIALRSYLVSKQGASKIAALKFLNDNFMHQLMTNPDLDKLLSVFTLMHSNIHACPQVIKKCIFYLSIFHQGSRIRRDRLVRRWIAEGYSEGIDSISMAVYTETKLFHKLAELGMITKQATAESSKGAAVNSSGTMRMSSCQVNSFILEYITMREMKDSIFLPLEVTVLEGGRSPPMTQHVGQHLAIRDWKGEKAVFDCLDFTRLRSLTVSGQWQPFFVSDMMVVLRVLDLEGTTSNLSDDDLEQIVEQLPRLKFLSLRGCKKITRLPCTVGELRQLQALDVRGTKIVRLPGSIVKLQKLQYLRAGADDGQGGGIRVPAGIGALKALHTLGAIDVSSSCTGVAILNKLHTHQQLRKLHVSGIIKKRHTCLCACVACFVTGGQASSGSIIRFPTNSFGELKVLEIACSPGMHVQFAQGAVPKLEKVKLYCHDGSSPQFSGLTFLRSSVKQILLKGPGCSAVRNELKVQLDQQFPYNKIELAIDKDHGSQPEPRPAQGNQQISESNPPAEGNQQISESSQAEGNQQISESSQAEGNQQIWVPNPTEGNQQISESSQAEGNQQIWVPNPAGCNQQIWVPNPANQQLSVPNPANLQIWLPDHAVCNIQ